VQPLWYHFTFYAKNKRHYLKTAYIIKTYYHTKF